MPEPRVVSAVREFKAALLAHEQGQMAEMTRCWLQVEKTLERQIAALNEEIFKTATDLGNVPSRAQILRMERYQTLLAQVKHEVGKYEDWAEGQIMQTQADMITQGIDQAMYSILETGIRRSFNRINESALENIVGLCADGSPLFDVLKARALWPDAVGGLTDALVNGVALGQNPRVVAAHMKDGLAQGLNKALQISRSEMLRAYRSAGQAEYKASGVVERYRRLAAHSVRTCAGCLASDGEEYDNNVNFESHTC
jgi:hypothetical protein